MPHRPPEPFNCPNCGTKYALVRIEAPSTPTVDLTGLFWTKLCEKLSLERSFGDAEEEVQRGADCDAASSDRSLDVTRQSDASGMPGGRDFAAELRDECLNGEIFYSLKEAIIVIEQWRK